LHPSRTDALLQKPGVIDDQDGIAVSEVFHHVVAHVVQDLVGVPLDPVQQPVDAIGPLVPGLLRQRPAVLALQRRNQPTPVSQRRLTRLLPVELVYEPLMESTQFTRPQPDISKVPTLDHTSDRAGQQSRQRPLRTREQHDPQLRCRGSLRPGVVQESVTDVSPRPVRPGAPAQLSAATRQTLTPKSWAMPTRPDA
jgi:hypothetical protein